MTFEEWYEKYNREEDDNHPHWLLKSAYNFALHESPGGYALVPVEPTEKMIEAGYAEVLMPALSCYKAMIQAAQEEE